MAESIVKLPPITVEGAHPRRLAEAITEARGWITTCYCISSLRLWEKVGRVRSFCEVSASRLQVLQNVFLHTQLLPPCLDHFLGQRIQLWRRAYDWWKGWVLRRGIRLAVYNGLM